MTAAELARHFSAPKFLDLWRITYGFKRADQREMCETLGLKRSTYLKVLRRLKLIRDMGGHAAALTTVEALDPADCDADEIREIHRRATLGASKTPEAAKRSILRTFAAMVELCEVYAESSQQRSHILAEQYTRAMTGQPCVFEYALGPDGEAEIFWQHPRSRKFTVRQQVWALDEDGKPVQKLVDCLVTETGSAPNSVNIGRQLWACDPDAAQDLGIKPNGTASTTDDGDTWDVEGSAAAVGLK